MFMKRALYSDLLRWKDKSDRKPLLLYGARQVGKTYLLKEFGKKEFKTLIYLNCDKNKPLEGIFNEDYDVDRIIKGLEVLAGQDISSCDSLIFFDEVQEIPQIVTSLKYFCENAPQYHIVAAGSLLGVHDLKGYSFPVGKVDILYLYPLTYEEYLWACNEENKALILHKSEERGLVNNLLPQYIESLRQYYFVGGMPEAVARYIEDKDIKGVREIQRNIISGYYADISKHAGKEAPKCRLILDNIPSQLAKENKKYIYGAIKKGARAKEFENAIQWLVDAGIIYKINRVSKVDVPLKFYLDLDAFKLFILDVGLLGAMLDTPAEEILVGNKIFSEYKGAFTENYVIEQLVPNKELSVVYYSKPNSTLELDFVVQKGSHIYPIEVKAEENVRSKSLRQFIDVETSGSLRGIRVSMKGFESQNWMENIPLPGVVGIFE